jgi:membrane-bound metal-dependent hydrolase YbcI (DUF457 family)
MYTLFLKDITFDYIIFAMVFAILPDLDIFLFPLRRKFNSNYLEHRSASHSYIIGVILSTFIGFFYSLLTKHPFFIIWIIGIIFYGIHISLDLLNTTKIPYFYPISKREYCFSVERAGSTFTFLTSLIFITSFMMVYNFFPDNSLLLLLINTYTYFLFAYYTFRILTRIWVNFHLNENQKYFPGVFPFFFFIFERQITENRLYLKIEKRSHFWRNKVIYENSENLTIEEMAFLKKGLEVCMENYYYAKWTVLPKIYRIAGEVSLKLFFMEPMIREKAHYIQFDFNKELKAVIGYRQSFGRINT